MFHDDFSSEFSYGIYNTFSNKTTVLWWHDMQYNHIQIQPKFSNYLLRDFRLREHTFKCVPYLSKLYNMTCKEEFVITGLTRFHSMISCIFAKSIAYRNNNEGTNIWNHCQKSAPVTKRQARINEVQIYIFQSLL